MTRPALLLAVALLQALMVVRQAAAADAADGIGDNVAGAKGLDAVLQKRHAKLEETPALSPADEQKAFHLREGFAIDLIASEPTVRQPLNLTFDERGRLWVVQYIQYPFPAGLKVMEYDQYIRAKFDKVPPPPPGQFKGNDVVSILEDTNGDGTFDKAKTFVDGLSICTSALPGRGGVWVLNPPYLLFYPDANRDDVPDGPPMVHLSGFGLEDTHAVASSLMWGPDGWIYGAHGSTCTSKVKVEVPTNPQSAIRTPQSTTDFLGQCIWRYHPERHVFEIFAEGGGNTFGVAFDDAGRVYSGTNWGQWRGVHYVQGGYYIKAWGKHGPLTNPYAFGFFPHMTHTGANADRLTHTFDVYGGGLLGADLDGKIIGPNPIMSRVSVSALKLAGSTFQTSDDPPMLTSDDGWFRPVDLKTGPDGAVYLADLYERRINHVDPRDNWHRESGRLWRIRPTAWRAGYAPFDLASKPSGELIKLLDDKNRWCRATARRILADRRDASVVPALRELLAKSAGRLALEAMWALNACGGFDESVALVGLNHPNPVVRAWAIRLLTDDAGKPLPAAVAQKLVELAGQEGDAEVRAQLASSAKRMDGRQAVPVIAGMLGHSADCGDAHIPLLLWWAVESKAGSERDQIVTAVASAVAEKSEPLARDVILQRLAHRYAADATPDNQRALVRLFELVPGDAERGLLVAGVNEAFAGGAVSGILPALAETLARTGNTELALRAGDAKTHQTVLEFIRDDAEANKAQRIRYIEILGQVGRSEAASVLLDVAETSRWHSVRIAALAAAAHFEAPDLGKRIVAIYPKLPADQGVRPAAIATLLTRPDWTAELLRAVKTGTIARADISREQLAVARKSEDKDVVRVADDVFGPERRPSSAEKMKEFERIKAVVLASPGNADAGKALFTERCAVCHTLVGQGGKVGPDLTGYERANVDNMLINVIDPGAYIREEFQTFGVRTKSGQTLVGIITERGPNQITLADSTGRATVVPKAEIKSEKALPTSTMPEGLLDGLTDAQLRDLFGYLGTAKR